MDWQLSLKPASARPQDLCELHVNAYAKAWREWRDGWKDGDARMGLEGWKKQNGTRGRKEEGPREAQWATLQMELC